MSLKVEVQDFVATVTLDNPPVNSASIDLMLELTSTFDAFNERDDVRAVLLTGEGKVFCAGADLKNRPGPDSPLGTAYAVWTGVGAVGTALVGVLLFKEPATAARLVCLGLIVAGILGLKVFSPAA